MSKTVIFEWSGKNLLGSILMELCNEFMVEMPGVERERDIVRLFVAMELLDEMELTIV